MKKITLLLFLLSLQLSSQNHQFDRVDDIVGTYKNITSIEELVQRIDRDFKTKLEKAKATYSWIASNISYKTEIFYIEMPKTYYVTDKNDFERRIKKENEAIIQKTFKTRKAVCNGYSLLFKKMSDLLGLESEVILGYIKSSPQEIGVLATQKNHAWNAVKINNRWMMLDITYGSGYALNDVWQSKLSNHFFDIKKEVIRMTHFPEKPFWQEYLDLKPLDEFCDLPLYSTAFFNTNFEILSPTIGEIEIQNKNKIQLKIKGLKPSTKVSYQFGDSKAIRKAAIYFNNSIAEISIKSPRRNTDLKIYFDNLLALEYKVSVD